MHRLNENWAAEVLEMKVNPAKGADLIDDKKIVEVKFKAVYPEIYTHFCWRVLDYQMNYKEREARYWALGAYELPIRASEIRFRNLKELEKQVGERYLWIVKWDWMKQFPFYLQEGETTKTTWSNRISFPKGSKLPEVEEEYPVRNGRVYVTKGVNKGDFQSLRTNNHSKGRS
jgi:hypothetical protein